MNLTKPQKLIYDMEKFAGGTIAVICGSMLIHGTHDLSELKRAVNEIYRLNDALRIRISEGDGEVSQSVTEYIERNIVVLYFDDKAELDRYAENYAKTPIDFYGNLCEISIVILPEQYGLLVKLHHIIGDAWTLSLIGNQFNALLNGDIPEAYSYTDYIESENHYFNSERYAKDMTYFLEQFKKCDEVTYMNEKSTDNLSACRKAFVIDSEKAKQITDYAQQSGTSAFMLFTAALSAYINRIKMNAEKFYIGTAVLNRSGTKEKNTVGMFINTVPMLMELKNDKSFAENLSSIETTAFSVFRHQTFNYGDILSAIRKEYGFTEKLYDVMLSYQNATILGNDIETTWYHCGVQNESLQIHIDDRDHEGVFRIHYDYQTEKFTEYDIDMLHQHICNLIFDAVKNDTKKLYELELLTADEKHKLLFDFNDTAVDYPRDKCVHQLFEEQVAKTPDKIALKFGNRTFTFSELNSLANGLAVALQNHGIGHGDVVAIISKRSYHIVVAMLAIFKCGAAYLPIDYNYPKDRIDTIANDADCKAILTYHVDYASEKTIDILEEITAVSKNLDCSVNPKDICGIIYTSGSTGTPKGTLLHHQGLVNYTYVNNALYEGGSYNIGFAIYTFDAFFLDLIPPMLRGNIAVMATEEEQFNQIAFENLIKNNPECNLFITPAKLKQFIDNRRDMNFYKKIHNICIGGEVFPQEFIDMFSQSTNVFNVYGPTECSMWMLECPVTSEDVTLGKPMGNVQVYILDKNGSITPIGVTGELCIVGDGVGAGYLNRPELTAEKFVDNPFGKGKLYKTGDLAYWREDGNIVYVGRNDFQVKIRGLRIELGEIENAICGVDGISQAVVVVRKNNEGRQLICAFYTGAEIEAKDIRSHIGKKLPKYMLPHIFTHLDKMPLTSSGKINRKALPEVDLYAVDTTVEYIAPQTEREKILVSAIEATLSIDRVGIMDNFFDIGGDSLKAIELISKLEKQGYHTDTKTIFDCDTVKKLAKKLTDQAVESVAVEYGNVIPATAAQMRVYTAQGMDENSSLYNIPYAFKVDTLDVIKLENAVNKLIERHESLRTHFENQDGYIVQVIDNSARITVTELDSEDFSAFVKPFDLTKAPLIRVGYYKNTVILDIHHIICDGGTMPVLFRELNELYMGRKLTDNVVQYGEFAAMKQNSEKCEKYWLSVFDDEVPVLELPTDFNRTDKQSFKGNAVYDFIDTKLHSKIAEKCKQIGITPYVFYMSGFNILLSKFSGNEDIVVGIPISGRDAKYLDTVGMFVNTVAIKSKLKGNITVADLLNEVKVNSVAAIDNQNYPFGELVKKLHIDNSGRNPLFDVMFAYQSEEMTDVIFGDQKAELIPIPVTTAKCDFTFNILPRKSGVVILVEYCTDLYKQETIQRFIDSFKLILEQCLNDNAFIKNITAISEKERDILLNEFNDTTVEYSKDKCVHQLFEEQVIKTPDKVAVNACGKALTYAELNKQANSISHSLIEKGIGVGDIVAFALPRKSYLISSMLGILKAGAAYLPIDPDYPQDRIEYMLSDSNAKLFITKNNIDELLDNSNTSNPIVSMSSDDLCYCIYTSGSTGQPKGTLLKHQGIVNLVTNLDIYSDLSNCERIGFMTTITFDVATQEIFTALLNGFTGVLMPERKETRADEIIDDIIEYKVDVMYATPTYFDSLTDTKEKADRLLSNIKVVCLAGEKFGLNNKILALKDNYNVIFENQYGPVELHVIATATTLQNNDFDSIGKPVGNDKAYIVDQYMHPVPISVTGELCIAGDGVGAGYLNRPELTAEKFVDNPFGKGKLYKTGDLAYWREDGSIVYVGRNDFQVKIRGLRIELGEIENAICSIDGISQAVVVVRKNSEGRQLICAFYTGTETNAKDIRSHIGKKLPKYMLPHIFTHLDEMPLTSSGKTNRKALPEIDLENIVNDTEYVAPENQQQKELCKLIESVLGTTPVGITDDFFDLGGDSLKAIEFVSKAHNEGIYFNLQNVFDYPIVKALCDCIENGDKQDISFADVDFTAVNNILEKNKSEYITAPSKADVGNILLAGTTGYLGIHILANFLDNDSGIAYCLVRGKDKADSTKRLKELLDFYFGNKYTDMHRIEVICADLQKDKFGLTESEYKELWGKIDTVINCAASVKHYGSYKYFFEANVETTKRLIEFCKAADAKLIHISTVSVSGNSFADEFTGYVSETVKHFYESSLYIGQPLDNVYAHSKFEAEKAVLDAMADGLQANIMRMGNLTNRFSDGVFQKNYESNAALQRVKSMLELGMVPDYLMDIYCEFTPIDEAANAVMTITRNFSTEHTVFHINSIKVVYFDKLLKIFNELGFDIRTVSGAEFTEALRQTAKQAGMEHIFETFINDMDENDQLNYDSNIRIENDFTVQYLKQLGFEWSDIGIDYLRKYVEYFRKIGYLK